jgi:hypothetical protein
MLRFWKVLFKLNKQYQLQQCWSFCLLPMLSTKPENMRKKAKWARISWDVGIKYKGIGRTDHMKYKGWDGLEVFCKKMRFLKNTGFCTPLFGTWPYISQSFVKFFHILNAIESLNMCVTIYIYLLSGTVIQLCSCTVYPVDVDTVFHDSTCKRC